LSRLDLVWICELIPVRVENLLVRVRVSELFLCDLAEGIACFDRVGLRRCLAGRRGRLLRGGGVHLDVSLNLLLPIGNRFDGIPDFVGFLL
jgi:hypothetical protein